MMDRTLEDTFYILFTTRAFATGIPTTLAGTPVVSAYGDANLTQLTAGITLGVDHDGVTGLNVLTIVATTANGYAAGTDYNLVITTGTVGGVSVVGEVVGAFSLGLNASYKIANHVSYGNAQLVRSTTPANTLNIDANNRAEGLLGAVTHTGAVIPTVSVLSGHTAQTGDTFAQLPTNLSSMVISGSGIVDALVQGYLNTLITETTAGRIAGNIDIFFENSDALTTKTVDDVGVAGSGLTQQNVRDAMKLAPTGGAPTADSVDDHLDTLLARIIGTLATGTHNPATAAQIAVLSDWIDGGRLDVILDAIRTVTDAQGVTGAGLSAMPWNVDWDAEVQSEVNDALVALHLDHLLAVDYDPAAKPGVLTALFNELIESDAGISRYTVNALENAPSGSSSGLTPLTSGTAQGGSATDIILAQAPSFANNTFNGCVIKITGGAGAGQARIISSYFESIAFIVPNWIVSPNNTSVYEVVEGSVNIEAISLDNAAANNLELDYDGTGYNKANSTIGTSTVNTDIIARATEARLSELDAANLPAGVDATLKGGIAMAESYAANGSTATPEQMLYMIWSALSEFAISGTTITARRLDGSTSAMTFTLDDGTNPTSRTRAT